jgi:hypothetical protein
MEIINIQENDNEFINYLTKKLNEDDEKQFCINFSLYLKYGNDNTKFPIDFDIVWKLLGFDNKYNGTYLLKKYFKENIDYKIYLLQSEKPLLNIQEHDDNCKKQNGGQNKQTIMLNVITFKKFCLKASTKDADKVIDYYIKLENIFFDYTNDKLIEQNKRLLNYANKSIIKQNNIFKNSYDKKNVIYIMILQEFSNNYIIKIGYTDDIKNRIVALENHFGCKNIIIKDIYECENNKKFEYFLHNHNEIVKYKYSELINNKIKSTETYLIKNEEEYNKIKNIIDTNIMNYDTNNLEELKIKYEMYKLQVKEKEIELQMKLLENLENSEKIERLVDKLNTLQINKNIVDILSNEDDENFNLNILNQYEEKQNTVPFIQCYDPETRKLVRTFNGITEATRELKNASFSQIKHAAHHNTIYLNYRWVFVYKKEDLDKEIEDIGETTQIQNRVSDMIAIINLNNEIEDVLINQKAVSEKLNKCYSMINIVIKTKKIIDNKKLVYWNEVPEKIKNKYLENNTLPEKTEKLKGKKIIKLNPDTKEIVKTYLSITDLTKEEKVSYKTIKKAIELKEQYNGFLWSY